MKEKFLITLLFKLFDVFLEAIAFYLLFLKLDVAIFGVWVFSLSIINIGFMFVNIGFNIIHFQYSGKKNSAIYFGTFFYLKITMISLSIIITSIIITILQLWNSNIALILMFLLFSRILFQISRIFIINLKSKLKVFKGEIPLLVFNIGKGLSVIYIAFNVLYLSDPLLYLSGLRLVCNLILILLVLYFSKKEFHFTKINKEILQSYLRDVKPLFVFSIVSVIASNLGNLILYYSFGHESLGYYSFINTYVITVLIVLSGMLTQLFIMILSQYFEMNNLSVIKQILYLLEKYSSIFFLSFLIIIFSNGSLIFMIFLPKYKDPILIIYILTIIPVMIGISRPYEFALISGKKHKIKYNIESFINIIIVIMMIFFIPPSFIIFQGLGLGSIGYALSQSIPWILWAILIRYFCVKDLNIKPQKKIIIHFILAFFSIIITLTLKTFILNEILTNSILLFIISSLIALGLFLGFLFFSKELRMNDIKFFIEMLDLKRYKKSFQEEFSSDLSF